MVTSDKRVFSSLAIVKTLQPSASRTWVQAERQKSKKYTNLKEINPALVISIRRSRIFRTTFNIAILGDLSQTCWSYMRWSNRSMHRIQNNFYCKDYVSAVTFPFRNHSICMLRLKNLFTTFSMGFENRGLLWTFSHLLLIYGTDLLISSRPLGSLSWYTQGLW